MIVKWDEGEWSEQPPNEEGFWWWDGFGREGDAPTLFFIVKSGSGWWAFPFNGKQRKIPEDGFWLGPVEPPTGPVNFGTAHIEEDEG